MRTTSHHVNASPFYLTINSQQWISAETKARLLEWKIRYDLIQYAARGVPELSLDQIKAYQPKSQGTTSIAGKTIVEARQLPAPRRITNRADLSLQRSHQRSTGC